MPLLSAFTPCGHLKCSARPALGQRIYESMRDSQGSAYSTEWDSVEQARLYADAMCLAGAQIQMENAANNNVMLLATDLLPQLEKDYQLRPGATATLHDRRMALLAARELVRGNARYVINATLIEHLGDAYLGLAWAAKDDGYDPINDYTWPAGAAGANWRTPKVPWCVYRTVGRIYSHGLQWVTATRLFGDSPPAVGDTMVVEAGAKGLQELVTIADVTSTALRATFTRAHPEGALCTTGYFPFWFSAWHHLYVVVTAATLNDAAKLNWLQWYLSRAAKGVATWTICTPDTTVTTVTGPFYPVAETTGKMAGIIDHTPIGRGASPVGWTFTRDI